MAKKTDLMHKPTQTAVSNAWPAGLSYHGHMFFETYIEATDQMEEEIKAFSGDIYDVQECYLGYSPSQDRFFCAFDAWTESGDNRLDDDAHNVIEFKIDKETRRIRTQDNRDY